MKTREERIEQITEYISGKGATPSVAATERQLRGVASDEGLAMDADWIGRAADVLADCPDFQGTEKQVAYAEDTRLRIVCTICADVHGTKSSYPRELLDQFKVVDDAKLILDRLT